MDAFAPDTPPRAVYHGFGITAWEPLKSFPWYSVDSSSWGQGFRFGNMPVFDYARGTFVKLSLGDTKGWYTHAALVRGYGFDPGDFADRARYDRKKAAALAALSYINAERWLRGVHGVITRPDDGACGVRVHLADANTARHAHAQEGVRVYLAEGGSIKDPEADSGGLRVYLADAMSHGKDTGFANDDLRLYLADGSLDINKQRHAGNGLRLYLADTSNGVNHARAARGIATALTGDA